MMRTMAAALPFSYSFERRGGGRRRRRRQQTAAAAGPQAVFSAARNAGGAASPLSLVSLYLLCLALLCYSSSAALYLIAAGLGEQAGSRKSARNRSSRDNDHGCLGRCCLVLYVWRVARNNYALFLETLGSEGLETILAAAAARRFATRAAAAFSRPSVRAVV